jgi:diacylglycerol O-acyltransferase / wax synthase
LNAERLSALDASFLAVEGPTAPMHVGWVATFDSPEDGPRPTFDHLATHIASRLDHAPRYRQRLAEVPLAVHEPVWVDDPDFDPGAHLFSAGARTLDELVDEVLSTPLARDRPLWEMWLATDLPDGRIAMVGKAHHCMVDGIAALQLAGLLLDREPDALNGNRANGSNGHNGHNGRNGWAPVPAPSPGERLVRAVAERAEDSAALALAPLKLAGSPRRLLTVPAAARRGARTLAHTVLPPARSSSLNRPGSADRRLERVACPLDDLRGVRRRFGVTLNDAMLAVCAGALRRFALRRGEEPQPLKAMVPVNVRGAADAADTGNRISFLFVELPCHEPDPLVRLMRLHRATAQRKRDGEAADTDAALRALALTPKPVQRALAGAVAHPRLFNLVVSNVPGPALPLYLRGCRLRELYPAVPLADRHALSIGVATVAGRACFGLYADAVTLPDAGALADDLDASIAELVAAG